MVIQTTKAYTFQLFQHILKQSDANEIIQWRETAAIVLASCTVFPGTEQAVPDWVSFDPLFLTAIADGSGTILTAPTGVVTLNAGETSANVALPSTGQRVAIMNTGSATAYGASSAFVLLGNSSSVAATISTGLEIPPGSSAMLSLNENAYLAAIGLQSADLLNVAVC